jgi:hypothetical protein
MTPEQAKQIILELVNVALGTFPPIARSAVAQQAQAALMSVFPQEAEKPKEG